MVNELYVYSSLQTDSLPRFVHVINRQTVVILPLQIQNQPSPLLRLGSCALCVPSIYRLLAEEGQKQQIERRTRADYR